MRYSNEHKQQTRERLLASSGALAKRGVLPVPAWPG